ncbi:MAG: replication initiator protein [Microviridae sp.]|nr:MAG: replication initiator protein [Microviridae sp.]
MCLYPTQYRNRKYLKNKKNGGIIPPIFDSRTGWVPGNCGNCMECRKEKAREWRLRLLEDIKTNTNGKFITLTFSNEWYKELHKITTERYKTYTPYEIDNEIATLAMRRFNERWRKKFKKAIRHWTVTELGHNGTENIHLHGILWTDKDIDEIKQIWKYGYTWPKSTMHAKEERIKGRYYVNDKTINYTTKYINKIDLKHKYYKSIILTSPGIGANYINSVNATLNQYKGKETNLTYITKNGNKIAMPAYWKRKLYTEEERERLWINKMDEDHRYVNGEKVSIKNGTEQYEKLIEWNRKINKELGYRGNEIENEKQKEEYKQRYKIQNKRIK